MSQQAYNFEKANYLNNYEVYFSQPHNIFPSYHHSGWGTYDNFSYGNLSIQSQESSSSYFQEQIKQPSDDELFLALKEEIEKDKEALEFWWPNMETKIDAKMITDMDTNLENFNRELCAIMDRTTIQA